NQTASIVRASKAKKTQPVAFYVFDILPYDAYVKQVPVPLAHRERHLRLQQILAAVFSDEGPIRRVPFAPVDHWAEAEAFARRQVQAAFEGAVLKDPTAGYAWGERNTAWLKVKFTIEEDVTVTGVQEGEGRLAGCLGALQVRTDDGREFAVG